MKEDVAKAWVEALRSGKYQQTNGVLNDGQGGFCCLGVLCDISGVGKWAEPLKKTDNLRYEVSENDWTTAALPDGVQKYSGMKSCMGVRPGQDSLASLNDFCGRNFNEIADIIEKEWKTL